VQLLWTQTHDTENKSEVVVYFSMVQVSETRLILWYIASALSVLTLFLETIKHLSAYFRHAEFAVYRTGIFQLQTHQNTLHVWKTEGKISLILLTTILTGYFEYHHAMHGDIYSKHSLRWGGW